MQLAADMARKGKNLINDQSTANPAKSQILSPKVAQSVRKVFRLDKRTLSVNTPKFKDFSKNDSSSYQVVSIIDYGDGFVEGSWGWSNGPQKTCAKRGESADRAANQERSRSRAGAQVRRICMSQGFDHLLTLTYRENVTDRHRCWRDLEQFVRRVHRTLKNWGYVVVPEYQKRGAVHFHLAVKGFQNVALLRACWLSVVGDGNIDVSRGKGQRGSRWKRQELASYLAKYVRKALVSLSLNEQSYRASKGLVKQAVKVLVPFPLKAKDYLMYKLEQIAGKVGFVWEPEESKGWHGWACSWE